MHIGLEQPNDQPNMGILSSSLFATQAVGPKKLISTSISKLD